VDVSYDKQPFCQCIVAVCGSRESARGSPAGAWVEVDLDVPPGECKTGLTLSAGEIAAGERSPWSVRKGFAEIASRRVVQNLAPSQPGARSGKRGSPSSGMGSHGAS
jgi:hypothetical protein